MKHVTPSLSPRQIWGMPALLSLLTAVGLLSALLGDGLWDLLSWIAMTAPLAVIVWHAASAARRHGR